ncbi:DNA modification methylase [Patescibacteria group bacterium]|nr:DNA modification methylase [Patescibacteria group bacterium]
MNDNFKTLIPPLDPDEYLRLEESILKEGCRDAIVLWEDTIIDGHTRFEICSKHNIPFNTSIKEFSSENEVKIWIINNQFARRNLSAYDRAKLALQIEGLFQEKAKENQGIRTDLTSVRNLTNVDTKKELAKIANVSHDTIMKVKKIEELAPEDVKRRIKTGTISINEAYKEVRKEEIRGQRIQQINIGKDRKINVDFRLGDFEEVLSNIPDNSVDCIITDPPYAYEYIQCWTKLSRFAAKKLKPEGFCVAYSGQYSLPEVMGRMNEFLRYYWVFALYHEGLTQIVNGVNIICRWKPILVYQKGKKKLDKTIQDYISSDKREKGQHDWQQGESGVLKLIEQFTEEGDLIVDPFAGSGTTIKAAIKLKRNVIAAEIDEDTFNIAKAGL